MRTLGLLLIALCVGRSLSAQGDTVRARGTPPPVENVPGEAKALVVSLRSYFGGPGTAAEFGAGIIVGASAGELYVATARHVVRGAAPAHTTWVLFPTGDSARADVASYSDQLDLAVLRIPADPERLARWIPRSWDRRAARGSVDSDDPVNPVGCPQDRCWQAPTPADRVMWAGSLEILFQSAFVGVGSSGGALFNRSWEVVGMVTVDEPPRGGAIPIDKVVAQLDTWGIPVGLREPRFPRGGYRTSVGATVMNATQGPRSGARLPSGRVTLVRQVLPAVSWHVSALRLAPENLAITAGMAGAGVELRKGRFVARPFIEAGFGRTEGRFDLGGYYVAGPNGPRYVPFWQRVRDDGLGIGGGVTIEAMALPRTIVEITTGYWNFTTPQNAPQLRSLFVGAGLRWGL